MFSSCITLISHEISFFFLCRKLERQSFFFPSATDILQFRVEKTRREKNIFIFQYQKVSLFDLILARYRNTQQANDTSGIYKAGVGERLVPSALLPAAIKFMSIICYLDQKVFALLAFMSFAGQPGSEEL